MKITQENADRLDETRSEWDNFRYTILSELEPRIRHDHGWISPYTKTLTDIVELAREDATSEDDEEDGDEEDNNSKSEE